MTDEKQVSDLPAPQSGKKHPESLSDPPKREPTIDEIESNIASGLTPAAIVALAPLGYDVLEPKPEAIELCARIIHATVEAMNAAFNENTLDWATSGPSVIDGIHRTLANPDETPEQNHNAWMEYKRKEGWVYGPAKDPELKTHPCMLPFSALGPFQQSKDAVFHAIVRTMFGVK